MQNLGNDFFGINNELCCVDSNFGDVHVMLSAKVSKQVIK